MWVLAANVDGVGAVGEAKVERQATAQKNGTKDRRRRPHNTGTASPVISMSSCHHQLCTYAVERRTLHRLSAKTAENDHAVCAAHRAASHLTPEWDPRTPGKTSPGPMARSEPVLNDPPDPPDGPSRIHSSEQVVRFSLVLVIPREGRQKAPPARKGLGLIERYNPPLITSRSVSFRSAVISQIMTPPNPRLSTYSSL